MTVEIHLSPTVTSFSGTIELSEIADAALAYGLQNAVVEEIGLRFAATGTATAAVTATTGDFHAWQWQRLATYSMTIADVAVLSSVSGTSLMDWQGLLYGSRTHVPSNKSSTSTDYAATQFIDDTGSAIAFAPTLPIWRGMDAEHAKRGRDYTIPAAAFTRGSSLTFAFASLADVTLAGSPVIQVYARLRAKPVVDAAPLVIIRETLKEANGYRGPTIQGPCHAAWIQRVTAATREIFAPTTTDHSLQLWSTYTDLSAPGLGLVISPGTTTARDHLERIRAARGDAVARAWPDFYLSGRRALLFGGELNARMTERAVPGPLIVKTENGATGDRLVSVHTQSLPAHVLAHILGTTPGGVGAAVDARARAKGSSIALGAPVAAVAAMTGTSDVGVVVPFTVDAG